MVGQVDAGWLERRSADGAEMAADGSWRELRIDSAAALRFQLTLQAGEVGSFAGAGELISAFDSGSGHLSEWGGRGGRRLVGRLKP